MLGRRACERPATDARPARPATPGRRRHHVRRGCVWGAAV